MSEALTPTELSQGGKREKRQGLVKTDKFGRSGYMQVLHIDLWYADGTKGEINVTSPHIIWGEDVETQWYHMRTYIKSQAERLGIVKYHAHCYTNIDGELHKAFSWHPFDLITNTEISA